MLIATRSPQLLFLVSGRDVPTTRYRMLPYLPVLREAGFRCHVAYSIPEKYGHFSWLGWRASQFLKRTVRQWHLWQTRLWHYDAVLLERELFDAPDWGLEAEFRNRVRRFILDVDDGIFLRYPEKFAALAGMSDLILAGNRNLVTECQRHGQHVIHFPTVVDEEHLNFVAPPQVAGTPVIGWIGTESNLPYLESILPALQRLAQTDPFVLRVVTGAQGRASKIFTAGIPAEFRQWSAAGAPAEISRFTVGIMPLEQTEWARYKCGFKLLQYLALKVPAVASPVGVNADILQEGVNGRLATSQEEWFQALQSLLRNPELRRQYGEAGRQRVLEQYSLARTGPLLVEELKKLLN